MTNKTSIIAKIQSVLTGNASVTSRSDHEEALHTDSNSLLESVYSAQVTDSHTSETYTSSSSLFDYTINIYKVGSNVTISGRFTVNSNLLAGSVIFDITDSDLLQEAVRYSTVATKNLSSDTIPIYVLDNDLKIGASVLNGEVYYFTINYKAIN